MAAQYLFEKLEMIGHVPAPSLHTKQDFSSTISDDREGGRERKGRRTHKNRLKEVNRERRSNKAKTE